MATRNPGSTHQLRLLVEIPLLTRFWHHRRWWRLDFWTINSKSKVVSHSKWMATIFRTTPRWKSPGIPHGWPNIRRSPKNQRKKSHAAKQKQDSKQTSKPHAKQPRKKRQKELTPQPIPPSQSTPTNLYIPYVATFNHPAFQILILVCVPFRASSRSASMPDSAPSVPLAASASGRRGAKGDTTRSRRRR